MKPFISEIISKNQNAFISIKMIYDNVLIAHEI